MPMTSMKTAARPKKMMEWMKIATPLVCSEPNSTTRPLPGIWNSSPGDSSTKSTTATNTGPQSAISLSLLLQQPIPLSCCASCVGVYARGLESERMREG
ncbi:unnamed protein product [Musa acuminata subsp. malaccensis]|uniref:(wild Malaysian banana) hypothetical protein n=1 Tax=Musa acuminata subsp. malaccensis TaxID=214687 RepID=A0A8D7F6N4_MUSAM|nr:unnamed protein product [Musa acuminata subsp. malaccensis]